MPGESCEGSADCAGEAECVSGDYTNPYCAPLCEVDQDCWDESTGMCGMCMDVTQFKFCMFYCQFGGNIVGCGFQAVCPGDMVCDGAVCR